MSDDTDVGGSATDVLHVDMDCFFAAVEALDDPSLAGKPLIVGGEGGRGVVASCSYEARAYGVHSAMPSVQARRLCPTAIFVGGHYNRYTEVSAQLHEIFADFTPLIEPVSLDEAFLDVGGAHRLLGDSVSIARAIRADVEAKLGLSCSVGVARSKLIAKLASRAAKPKASKTGPVPGPGVMRVAPEEEIEFLHRLPVRAIWGVGPKTADRLKRYAVSTVGDLAMVGEASLTRLLGSAMGKQLHALAWGRDERPVEVDRALKSVGHEETFARDDHDAASLHRQAVRMSDAVGARLHEAGVEGRTVTVKVRFGDFSMTTRSETLRSPTSSGLVIARVAAALLETVEVNLGVRLLGISVSGLVRRPQETLSSRETLSSQESLSSQGTMPAGGEGVQQPVGEQLSFEILAGDGRPVADRADRESSQLEEIDAAVDAIRRRFGVEAVGPASITGPGGLEVKRRGDAQWGPADRSGAGRGDGPAEPRR